MKELTAKTLFRTGLNEALRFALTKGREFIACLPGAAAKLKLKILN